MSCHEWERGEIRLPAGAMKAVREAVVEAHNKTQLAMLAAAEAVLVRVKAANKGKRAVKVDWRSEIEREARSYTDSTHGFEYWDVERLLMPTTRLPLPTTGYASKWQDVKATKPIKPKKKNLTLLPKRVERVSLGEASIEFNKDGRTVVWTVSENNHACERAREHLVARAFFSALGRVEWKRGSGGEIVGNDEYNRDNEHEGGGANYVKESFGPESKKSAHASFKVRRWA